MSSLPVFALASQHANWLSIRQAAVANNIANISTPGYRATDVKPFENVLKATVSTMRATDPRHIPVPGDNLLRLAEENTTTSGSSVSVEAEVMKASELRHDFELNTAIVKAFHRMILTTMKG